MEKKSSFLTLALAAAFAALPGAAAAQEQEIRQVSSAMMDALEAWSSPGASYETMALDAWPELVRGYVPVAETYHGGRSLDEVFAEQLPFTYAEAKLAFGGEGGGESGGETLASDELLAYAMSLGGAEYQTWQSQLAGRGAGFAAFVDRHHPAAARELERLNDTPAERGVALLDFVRGGSPELETEVRDVLATVKKKKDCTCWTVVNFPDQPSSWTTEADEDFDDQWGKLPKKRRYLKYYVWSRGAARDINFWRRSEHNEWGVSRDKSTNMSSMRVRMSCTKNNSSAGESCTGPTCGGQFVTRIGYASKVYERHEVGGVWSKQAISMAADAARLTYDDPGPAPATVLFKKGVAVSGEFQSSWNAEAAANLLYSVVQIGLTVAGDGTALAGDLSADLVNTAITSGAALITHSGSQGSRSRDMMAAYDNSVGTPIVLLANQTHLFELKAYSKIYGRGYGGRSESWANLDSAFYMVGVGRNYSCAANVTAPVARAHWEHARSSDAPYTTSTMQNFIGTFAETELGVYPANTASSPGQYPF